MFAFPLSLFPSDTRFKLGHRNYFRRMFTVTVAIFLAICFQAAAAEPFKFVQFTDIHLGWAGPDHVADDCLKLAKQVEDEMREKNEKIEFVVVTGDIIDKGFKELQPEALKRFHEFKKSFSIPVYAIPGNHDFSTHKFDEKEAVSLAEGFKAHIGPTHSSFTCNGYRMILFCELPLTKWSAKVDGYDPLGWLEKTLSEEPRMPSIIFMHVPPDKEWHEEALAKFKELVSRNDVKAVISGHWHEDVLSWEKSTMLFSSYSCTKKHGDAPSYKVYSVDKDGKISFKQQTLKDDKVEKLEKEEKNGRERRERRE